MPDILRVNDDREIQPLSSTTVHGLSISVSRLTITQLVQL